MITKEQEAALLKLECDTHALWNEEAALAFTKPFGFDCRMQEYLADAGPRNPKGLTLKNGAEAAVGAASWDIAGQICGHLGVRSERKLGRGSQVRADCEAVREHLNQGEK